LAGSPAACTLAARPKPRTTAAPAANKFFNFMSSPVDKFFDEGRRENPRDGFTIIPPTQ
jgi:hypothetical protein